MKLLVVGAGATGGYFGARLSLARCDLPRPTRPGCAVGFDNRLSATIDADMWEKWILLATIGAATCLMRGSVGDFAMQSGGERFLHGVFDEATSIATAAGRPPRTEFLSATRENP